VGGRPRPSNVEIRTFIFEAAIAIGECEVVQSGKNGDDACSFVKVSRWLRLSVVGMSESERMRHRTTRLGFYLIIT
jgi:hypothetical protein